MPRARTASPIRGSSEAGNGTRTGGRAGKWRVAVMHGPVDGEVSRSSRIRPSIAATLARRAPTSRSDRCGSRCLYHGGVPLAYWLPPALWMAAIMVFSSDVGSAQHTAHWLVPLLRLMAPSATPSQLAALHGLVRKAGHLTEYAVLATLWYRAFALRRRQPRRAAALTAFAISLGWAVLDEARQSLVPTRTATAMDVAIDGVGALVAMLLAAIGWRIAID